MLATDVGDPPPGGGETERGPTCRVFTFYMPAEDAESLVDMSTTSMHEEYKKKIIQLVTSSLVSTEKLTDTQLKKLCAGNVQTSKQCKRLYLHQLKVLLKRIQRTTNEAEGGECFRQDID